MLIRLFLTGALLSAIVPYSEGELGWDAEPAFGRIEDYRPAGNAGRQVNLSGLPGCDTTLKRLWYRLDNHLDPLDNATAMSSEYVMCLTRSPDMSSDEPGVRDGIVGGPDYAIFTAAYGSQPGDPNWDERADFDGDGIVGSTDFAIMGATYGARIDYGPDPEL